MNADSTCPAASGKKLLSIVLPVYDEELILPLLTAKIAKAMWASGLDYELIFVNDGSRDESGVLLDELASTSKRIRVVHLSRNFGSQAAIQAGLAHARGDAVVLMDSNLQDTPDAIPKMAAQWQAGYDIVYAIRSKRKEIAWKRFCTGAFHRLLSGAAAIPLPADTGNFSLIDRRVAQQLLALGECDRYFSGLRGWVGFRQIGIEIERNARYDSRSRTSLGRWFRSAKTAMFSFSSLPIAMFQAVAAASAAVFLGLGGFAVFYRLFTGWTIPGWTSAMLVGSFFTLLNSVGICVLGEYLVRIYDQVRNRPLYLVDRTVNLEACETGRQNTSAGIQPTIASAEEDFSGDEQYLALMDEAMSLLQAGSMARDTEMPLIRSIASESYETQEFAGLNQ